MFSTVHNSAMLAVTGHTVYLFVYSKQISASVFLLYIENTADPFANEQREEITPVFLDPCPGLLLRRHFSNKNIMKCLDIKRTLLN